MLFRVRVQTPFLKETLVFPVKESASIEWFLREVHRRYHEWHCHFNVYDFTLAVDKPDFTQDSSQALTLKTEVLSSTDGDSEHKQIEQSSDDAAADLIVVSEVEQRTEKLTLTGIDEKSDETETTAPPSQTSNDDGDDDDGDEDQHVIKSLEFPSSEPIIEYLSKHAGQWGKLNDREMWCQVVESMESIERRAADRRRAEEERRRQEEEARRKQEQKERQIRHIRKQGYCWELEGYSNFLDVPLEEEGRVVENKGSLDQWCVIRGDHPIIPAYKQFYFEVEIEHLPDTSNTWKICIGVVPLAFKPRADRHWVGAQHSWSYVAGNGEKCHNSGKSSKYGESYGQGDRIGVLLNFTESTLTFFKNGVSQGQAFDDFSGPVYPAVSLTAKHCRVRFCDCVDPSIGIPPDMRQLQMVNVAAEKVRRQTWYRVTHPSFVEGQQTAWDEQGTNQFSAHFSRKCDESLFFPINVDCRMTSGIRNRARRKRAAYVKQSAKKVAAIVEEVASPLEEKMESKKENDNEQKQPKPESSAIGGMEDAQPADDAGAEEEPLPSSAAPAVASISDDPLIKESVEISGSDIKPSISTNEEGTSFEAVSKEISQLEEQDYDSEDDEYSTEDEKLQIFKSAQYEPLLTLINQGSDDKWRIARTVGSFSGDIAAFEMEIMKSSKSSNTWKICIGVVPLTFTSESERIWVGSQSSWGYISGTGGKCFNSGQSTAYGERYGTGDVVTVVMNFAESQLEFFKNGESQGVAYDKFEGPVYGAVSLTGMNTCLRYRNVSVERAMELVRMGKLKRQKMEEIMLKYGNVWDESKMSGDMQISEEGLAVEKIGDNDKWRCCAAALPFQSGRRYFEVEVDSCPETKNTWKICIGVVTKEFNFKHKKLWIGAQHTWAYVMGNGGKCHHSGKTQEFAQPYEVGDVIGVLIDFDNHSIEFFRNSKPLGEAFNNVYGPVYAAVSVTGKGAKLRLVTDAENRRRDELFLFE